MLQRLFQKYTGFLRSLKAVYVINNVLNARRLWNNRRLYAQYGLHKNIFSPLGSADFPRHHPGIPWLDRSDAAGQLEQNREFLAMDPVLQAQVRQFIREGYLILENFIPEPDTEALNKAIADLLQSGQAGFNYTGRKIFNVHEHSPIADERFFRRPEILQLLTFLLGKPVIPFQSLSFVQGSEQRAHSDSIHMTTEPPGYLIATWTALEDCPDGSGLLFYYPGSHRLPYVMTPDYDSGNSRFRIGDHSNRQYEDKIDAIIREYGLERKQFRAKRGDLLIWHANLLHGGSAITRPGATRRSIVCHYFAEGVICYHEISQRPALLPTAAANKPGSNG